MIETIFSNWNIAIGGDIVPLAISLMVVHAIFAVIFDRFF